VPSYLVETYLARCAPSERAAHERRVRSAAAKRTHVRFDGSLHVPEDEICFFVFAAPTARDAALVAEDAGLDPLRVVEAIPSGKEKQ
jgi:hypothetical protein